MKTPPSLLPGDKIGIVAPARSVSPEEIETAVKYLNSKGFEVVLGEKLFGKQDQFSGSDAERTSDIQEFLDDVSVKAIICARGGYGSVRLLRHLDFKHFAKHPKWFVGYSDITVFHSAIHNLGIQSLHAPMVFNLNKPDANIADFDCLIDILTGNKPASTFTSHPLNRHGKAKGILVGGNLSVLYSLRGTPYDINTHGKIIFLEDIDEYLYHIDRMMMNLKLGGKLANIRGIIVGGMTDMKDNNVPFGKNAFEIIADQTSDVFIPVCFDFPAGHGSVNTPLIFGKEVVLEIGRECSLRYV